MGDILDYSHFNWDIKRARDQFREAMVNFSKTLEEIRAQNMKPTRPSKERLDAIRRTFDFSEKAIGELLAEIDALQDENESSISYNLTIQEQWREGRDQLRDRIAKLREALERECKCDVAETCKAHLAIASDDEVKKRG